MRFVILSVMLFAATPLFVFGQQPSPTPSTRITASPTPSSPVTTSAYSFPDSKTRFKRYIKGMVGPMTIGKSAFYAGIGTWRNSPEEWGDHWDGYGRRFASGLGTN